MARFHARCHPASHAQAATWSGETALHLAAAACRLEAVDALLAAGCCAIQRDSSGKQPLHHVALRANLPQAVAVARRLVTAGADPNAADNRRVTPLDLARQCPNPGEMLHVLAAAPAPAPPGAGLPDLEVSG